MLSVAVGDAEASGPGHVTIYAGLDHPDGITTGPDGGIWFTNNGPFGYTIGMITTRGKAAVYAGPGIDAPYGITTGPDGALWFTNYGGANNLDRADYHKRVAQHLSAPG